MLKMTRDICIKALYGGLLLGGGGGGQLCDGLAIVDEVFAHTSEITLLSADEIDDNDILITASLVGAPSAKERFVDADSWACAYENLRLNHKCRINGFITNENGAISTTNGWLLSALTGIPVVDVPCNGRAQPTAVMGSMGLHLMPDYRTVQSACGGRGDKYVELVTKGTIQSTSALIRQSAVVSGGFVAVLRNPVSTMFAKKNGATGGIAQAVSVGELIVDSMGDSEKILALLNRFFNAQVICRGRVAAMHLYTEGGYDRGDVYIQNEEGDYELTFWNEYITFDHNGKRIATFPDLISTVDIHTGVPLTSAEINVGREVVAVVIPRERLKLGAGMYSRELIQEAGRIVGKAV